MTEQTRSTDLTEQARSVPCLKILITSASIVLGLALGASVTAHSLSWQIRIIVALVCGAGIALAAVTASVTTCFGELLARFVRKPDEPNAKALTMGQMRRGLVVQVYKRDGTPEGEPVVVLGKPFKAWRADYKGWAVPVGRHSSDGVTAAYVWLLAEMGVPTDQDSVAQQEFYTLAVD